LYLQPFEQPLGIILLLQITDLQNFLNKVNHRLISILYLSEKYKFCADSLMFIASSFKFGIISVAKHIHENISTLKFSGNYLGAETACFGNKYFQRITRKMEIL